MSAPYLDLPIRSKNCAQDCQVLGVCHSLSDCQEAAAMQRIEAQAMQRMAERKAREQQARQAMQAKGQSHTHSWLEAVANIVVGFAVSLVITAIVLPAFGHHITLAENVAMTSIFTVASLARSYALRRIFNRITTRGNT